MELLLTSEMSSDFKEYNWDISVTDGIADSVPYGTEKDQEAAVIAYLEKTSIPLMEEKGTDWTGFLTKQKTIAEIDAEIRENIKTYIEDVTYTPAYGVKNEKLVVYMNRTLVNTGAI